MDCVQSMKPERQGGIRWLLFDRHLYLVGDPEKGEPETIDDGKLTWSCAWALFKSPIFFWRMRLLGKALSCGCVMTMLTHRKIAICLDCSKLGAVDG